MRICSTSENKQSEKRIAITPEITKKYINLGLEVSLIENYGLHLGCDDNQYKELGVNIVKDEKELVNNSDIIVQLGLLSDDKISIVKEKQTLIGIFDPYNNKDKIQNLSKKKINVVVATSGDTGSAAIDAIKGKDKMNIFVLHPNNKVSSVQRKLMTTVEDKNVFNIAIDGNFDDCQNLVKSMFADNKFSNSINMSGVNSINWARIVAQTVYYFFSYFQVCQLNEKINFSVPTGNFGDVYAGYLSKKMGLPIEKLIVATNQNDILHSQSFAETSYSLKVGIGIRTRDFLFRKVLQKL